MNYWKSYFARLHAANGHFLLGGHKEVLSSRFECYSQAVAWADVTRVGNEEAGRPVSIVVIASSERDPEIGANGEVL